MLEQAPATTLAVLLARVQAELDMLTRIVGEMQTDLSPILMDVASSDPEACRHAQNIDLVWQTLDSLSQVMKGAVREGAGHQPIEIDAIVGRLPLADLSSRLRGVGYAAHGDGGDLDLF